MNVDVTIYVDFFQVFKYVHRKSKAKTKEK